MANVKMPTLLVISVFILAGLSHAQEKDCSMDEVKVLSKMVTCITKDHPEYFLTVLTKMDNPAAMESPDFMCSHPSMMSAMVDCFLDYVKGCMPPTLSTQFSTVVPTHDTIEKGVMFLCKHRKAFQHPCVASQLASLIQCFNNKMQAFTTTAISYSNPNSHNVHDALCSALQMEEQCLAESLKGCPAEVASDIMSGLLTFFPSENCDIRMPQVKSHPLLFKPMQRH